MSIAADRSGMRKYASSKPLWSSSAGASDFVASQLRAGGTDASSKTLRVGDVEMILAEAPVKISVPEIPVHVARFHQTFMADGSPCCFHHEGVAAKLRCTKCVHVFYNVKQDPEVRPRRCP